MLGLVQGSACALFLLTLHFGLPSAAAVSVRGQGTSMSKCLLYIVSVSRLCYYVFCSFLVLSSQPAHNILQHLAGA